MHNAYDAGFLRGLGIDPGDQGGCATATLAVPEIRLLARREIKRYRRDRNRREAMLVWAIATLVGLTLGLLVSSRYWL